MNPYHSDEKDEVDPSQDSPKIQECETELQLYLESSKTSNLLHFWETNKAVVPRLYAITGKLFCAPATTAGVERLSSISGFVLSSKRLRMTDETFKNQVFAHCNSDLLNVASRKRKAENL